MVHRALPTILILIFVITHSLNQVNALCCTDDIVVYFACSFFDNPVPNSFIYGWWGNGKWACRTKICKDGSTFSTFRNCGIGSCDMFGCNCEGGCKTNSEGNGTGATDKALNLFRKKYKINEIAHGKWILKQIKKIVDSVNQKNYMSIGNK